jgi:hypothetical protein
MKSVFLVVTLLLFYGCASKPPAPDRLSDLPLLGKLYSNSVAIGYDGEIKAMNDVAILTRENGLYIVSINENKDFEKRQFGTRGLFPTGANQLHIEPGNYTIEFRFSKDSGNTHRRSKTTVKKDFELYKGQKIFLMLKFPSKGLWSVGQRDLTSDEFALMEKDFNQYVRNQF